jgi:hypothetical protein
VNINFVKFILIYQNPIDNLNVLLNNGNTYIVKIDHQLQYKTILTTLPMGRVFCAKIDEHAMKGMKIFECKKIYLIKLNILFIQHFWTSEPNIFFYRKVKIL